MPLSESRKTRNHDELKLLKLELSSILQITEAINQNFSTEQLLNIYQFVLHNQLRVDRLVLLMYDQQWKSVLSFGANDLCDITSLHQELTPVKKISPASSFSSPCLKEFETVIPVFHKDNPLAYVLVGNFLEDGRDREEDIIPFIQTVTNIIVVAIENKKLAREKIKQEGLKRELELAAQMQSMLLPARLPDNDKMEVTATYIPHQEVGGDYYDFMRLGENELFACLADVSGKGMAAALLASNFQANLHVLLQHYQDLPELARQLNRSVMKSAKGEKFITLFMAKFNIITREMRYVNAGHNPPLLYSDGKVRLLEEGSVGLGMFDELPFIREGSLTIPPRTILLCYTDGVVDLENDAGESFGLDTLKAFLINNAGMNSMKDFHTHLIELLTAYKQSRPFVDDITLFSSKGKFPF